MADLSRKHRVRVDISKTSQCLSVKGKAEGVEGFASEVNSILIKAAGGKPVTRSIQIETDQRGIAGITGKQFRKCT